MKKQEAKEATYDELLDQAKWWRTEDGSVIKLKNMTDSHKRNLLGYILKNADTYFPGADFPIERALSTLFVIQLEHDVFDEPYETEEIPESHYVNLTTAEILSTTTGILLTPGKTAKESLEVALDSVRRVVGNPDLELESPEFSRIIDPVKSLILDQLSWARGITADMVPQKMDSESEEYFTGYIDCWLGFISAAAGGHVHAINVEDFNVDDNVLSSHNSEMVFELTEDLPEKLLEMIEELVSHNLD